MDLPSLNLPATHHRIDEAATPPRIFDPYRRIWVALTPEEWVRQNLLRFLTERRGYPAGRTAVETTLRMGEASRRCDAVIYTAAMTPLLLVECKAPTVAVSEETLAQIAAYNRVLRAPLLLLSNGNTHFCCRIDFESGTYAFLDDIPAHAESTGSPI